MKTYPENRYCAKCGEKLSIYNPDRVCFCHIEHKNWESTGEDQSKKPSCAWGHATPMIYYMDINYYGQVMD